MKLSAGALTGILLAMVFVLYASMVLLMNVVIPELIWGPSNNNDQGEVQ